MVIKEKSIMQEEGDTSAPLNTELRVNTGLRDLSAQDRLGFAKWVLRGIACFFVLSILVWLYQASYGETLLDICRTTLLPIATFVIGDYFGSKK